MLVQHETEYVRVQAAQKRLFKKLKITNEPKKAEKEEGKYELQSLLAESDSDDDKDQESSDDEILDEEIGQNSALDNMNEFDQQQEQEEMKSSEYSAEF